MPHMTGMLLQGEAEALMKLAENDSSILGRVAGTLGAESLEKQARFFGSARPMRGDSGTGDSILSEGNPVVDAMRDFLRDHPPANMAALIELYSQATERALQAAITKMETSEDADPMGLALKNLQRMADILETRLDTLRAQREIQTFQQDLAAQQGLSQTNPALQANTELPAAVSPQAGAAPEVSAPEKVPSPPAGTAPPAPPAM